MYDCKINMGEEKTEHYAMYLVKEEWKNENSLFDREFYYQTKIIKIV